MSRAGRSEIGPVSGSTSGLLHNGEIMMVRHKSFALAAYRVTGPPSPLLVVNDRSWHRRIDWTDR